MTTPALPYILLLGFLFGSTLIASRFSVGQYSTLTYIGLRLVLASIAFLAVFILSRSRRLPRDGQLWRRASFLGIFGTAVPMVAIVTSLEFQSSGVTSILLTAGPAITVLLAHFTLADERLTLRKGVGVILALGGAFLLAALGESGLPDVSRASPVGYILVLSAMFFAGAATIFTRKYLSEYEALEVTSIRMYAAALAVMPLSLLLVGFDLSNVDLRGYGALLYAAFVGTFAGMLVLFYIIQRFGATASAMAGYVIPIVATLGGVLLLGETITGGMLAGMALIVVGLSIINQRVKTTQPLGEIAQH